MLFEKTQHLVERSSQHLYAIMSLSYVGAMLTSNYALQYISYPAQVINCHTIHHHHHQAFVVCLLQHELGTCKALRFKFEWDD